MFMQLKEVIAEKYSVSSDRLCLVYCGKILRDSGTVKSCGVKDGRVVNAVIKKATASPVS